MLAFGFIRWEMLALWEKWDDHRRYDSRQPLKNNGREVYSLPTQGGGLAYFKLPTSAFMSVGKVCVCA
jgi:hypothetical protein